MAKQAGLKDARTARTFHMSLGDLDEKHIAEVIEEVNRCKWRLVIAKRVAGGAYVEDRESSDL